MEVLILEGEFTKKKPTKESAGKKDVIYQLFSDKLPLETFDFFAASHIADNYGFNDFNLNEYFILYHEGNIACEFNVPFRYRSDFAENKTDIAPPSMSKEWYKYYTKNFYKKYFK